LDEDAGAMAIAVGLVDNIRRLGDAENTVEGLQRKWRFHHVALGHLRMSLLVRINLAFGGVFVVAAIVAGYAFWGILEGNARREVLAEAGLVAQLATACRRWRRGR
jgi:hypothetical protein